MITSVMFMTRLPLRVSISSIEDFVIIIYKGMSAPGHSLRAEDSKSGLLTSSSMVAERKLGIQ